MTHQRRDGQGTSLGLDVTTDAGDLDMTSSIPIELGDDIALAIRSVAGKPRRLVVRQAGEELAAIIPMENHRLLLRLEEEELDRIDLAEVRRALADPNNWPAVPWEEIKREAGL